MTQRAMLEVGAGFVVAALAAALAILAFTNVIRLSPGWTLIAAGAAIAGITYYAQQTVRELQTNLRQREHELELGMTQLGEQRAAIDSLADGLDVAVFICDARAEVQYANRRAQQLFSFQNPIGRSVIAVTLSNELEKLVVDAAREQAAQDAELVFTYPKERVGLAKAWPTETSNRVFLSIYEITELRRLMRVRQDFVANVSHELRTPMTVIRAMAETLLDEDAPAPSATADRYLKRIINEVDRLNSISQDLLVLSAAESSPVQKNPCDVAALFRNVLDELAPQANDKGIETSYEGPEQLTIDANSAQLSQVAINLIQNAINYTSSGTIEVCIGRSGDRVVIDVIDSGMGISSDNLSRIFERFYRVDRARSRSTGGTGLGLSIVKHIVEAHGGSITVESALNLGSKFTVTLPVDDNTKPATGIEAVQQ